MNSTFRVAVVGCGNISTSYGEALRGRPGIELCGAYDRNSDRSAAFCAKFGGTAHPSLEALLADDTVDAVINLTIHHSHAEITRRCLEAGRHVHTEKPLAMTHQEGLALAVLAEERGLRLGCSPFVFLGEAQETAFQWIREGRLGPVRLIYAEVNWGRIESWHPNPLPFYEVGVMADVGIYPLTVLTALFGPVSRVSARAATLLKDRVTTRGRRFSPPVPDYICASVEFAAGPLCRLTAGFYAHRTMTRQNGLEFHGDTGSLLMDSWSAFDAKLEFARYGEAFQPVAHRHPPFPGVDWSRCVVELASAIRENRPHRTNVRHASHVLEVIEAISRSADTGQSEDVRSSFPQIDPEGGGLLTRAEGGGFP